MRYLNLNKKILIPLAIIFLLSIFYIFINLFKKTNIVNNTNIVNKTNTRTKQADYKSIVPGITTKEQVLSKLGNPVKKTDNLLEYHSNNPNYNNQIQIEEDKVSFIKEYISLADNRNSKQITQVYGEPKNILYGPDANSGFFLYVYPENGIAYIGHSTSGLLLEIWYFPPTNIDNFMKKYAQEYSEKTKIIQ